MNAPEPVSPTLIEAAIHGGTAEADDLIRAVWPRAYRIAYSVLRSRTLAEDAAQEACAVLFRTIGGLRSIQAFSVWFCRIVVRQALMLEKRNRQATVDRDLDLTITSDLDGSVTRIDVYNALTSLAPAQRVAIALHFYAEMNSREIANVLSIPDSSVRFHIMRAKRELEKALRDDSSVACAEEPFGAA